MHSRFGNGLLAITVACIVLMQGCFGGGEVGGSCKKERVYQRSTEAPPLEVPPDLDSLDPEIAVSIPEPADQLQTTERKGECLEAPPEFFQGEVERRTTPRSNPEDDERVPET